MAIRRLQTGQPYVLVYARPESSDRAGLLHENLACEQIATEIRRHVDDWHRVDVIIPRADVCEFCYEPAEGLLVTEENATDEEPVGLPQCCEDAQAEFWAQAKG